MRILRWFVRILLTLLIVAAIGAGSAYWMANRSLPDYDGSKQVNGVSANVEIVRDLYGVPRIFAQSREDGLFGLGYAHATDRLWQMDVSRRLAQGRLSERFGEVALPTDTLMRALDLDGHAERSLAALSRDSRRALEAYSAGVNARLAEIEKGEHGRGAPEFYIFGGAIDPWRPADSLSVVKTMAFQISMRSLHTEAARGRILLALEPAQVRDLYPEYPGPGVDQLPRYRKPRPQQEASSSPVRRAIPPVRSPTIADTVPFDAALAFLGLDDPRMSGASAAWAVDGSRTAGRASLLASDPHLPLTAPAVWFPAQISAPDLSAIGASLPGVPAIVYGRTENVAWGLTATQLDDIDVFIERLNPDDMTRYLGPDGPLDFETRTEVIRVKGADDVPVILRRTRHGPVIPLTTAGLSAVTPPDHVAALAWTALSDDDTTFDAIMALNRATTAEEALGAARFAVAPALNLLVADRETVGMGVVGRVPLRRITTPTEGRVPSPGWNDRNDWVGWLPASTLPRLIEPESGALANANNRIGDRPFPRHLSFDWDAPYRINRIEKLINAQEFHSVESFKAMQADNGSEMARALSSLMGSHVWDKELPANAHPLRKETLARLKDWNGEMSEHAAEPLIFVAWVAALTALVVKDELGALAPAYSGPRPLFLERVLGDIEGASAWCDDIGTEAEESCGDVIGDALDIALENLVARYGEDAGKWRWGIAHKALHRNSTLSEISASVFGMTLGLGPFVNVEQETSGGDYTLNRGAMAHRGPMPFQNVHGSGYRGIYDFSDLDRSVYIVSTGVSGHPLSDFYDNLAPLWRIGEYMPMSMQRRDIDPGAVGRMILQPARSDVSGSR